MGLEAAVGAAWPGWLLRAACWQISACRQDSGHRRRAMRAVQYRVGQSLGVELRIAACSLALAAHEVASHDGTCVRGGGAIASLAFQHTRPHDLLERQQQPGGTDRSQDHRPDWCAQRVAGPLPGGRARSQAPGRSIGCDGGSMTVGVVHDGASRSARGLRTLREVMVPQQARADHRTSSVIDVGGALQGEPHRLAVPCRPMWEAPIWRGRALSRLVTARPRSECSFDPVRCARAQPPRGERGKARLRRAWRSKRGSTTSCRPRCR